MTDPTDSKPTPPATHKPRKAVATRAKTALPSVVALGASAGGMDAVSQFLQSMPVDSGAAFVVVQHLHPAHASLSAQLFARHTRMPVSDATDGVRLMPNHVYTTPPDKDIVLRRGRLRLTPRNSAAHLRLPIDQFFHSLGEECGARAIAIVLSGTGTDGTMGIKTVAAQGGIVLVQEPTSAEYPGMPRSAIASSVVNHVLSVQRMPAVISNYLRHPYVAGAAAIVSQEEDSKSIQSLIRLVQARRGYDFSGYKRSTLLRRVERRMGLQGILRLARYVALLNRDAHEVDALFRDLLIGVTEFFRDAEVWKALDADVIAPMVAAHHHEEPIRIWIPGCSTGEEAYTMAILVLDRLRRMRKRCPLQIFATDTNTEALEVGRYGRYPLGIAERMRATQLRRRFVKDASGMNYIVSDELRACVIFGVQNLFADPPFGRVDLISCRNVLIYLEPEVQKRVLNMFHFALRKDGHLLLGSAESNGGRDELFSPLSKKFRIYRRTGTTRPEMLALPAHAMEAPTESVVMPTRSTPALSQAANIAQKLILDRFAPASVLINSSYEVLYFCGPSDEFLVRPRGAPTQDLLVMVREGLRARMRAALREASTNDLPVDVVGARMKRGSAFLPVQISVIPSASSELGRLFLVVFRHDVTTPAIPLASETDGQLVRHLEEELQATRDDLQGTIERFEATNESLRVSNEEVITANEELRSLNEELESSKEELQSLNEELATVNQQLEIKVRELEDANGDLSNLLGSSDIATICLDRSLRIKWFAPATQRQFNFISGDVGRPVSDIASAIEDDSLVTAARSVVAGQAVGDHDFKVESGRWFIRRVLPYLTDGSQVSGVIVTYTDITDSRLAAQAASASQHDLTASQDQADKLRRLSAALVLAEQRERRALAQDLHDGLGQLLAVIGIKATVMKKHRLSAVVRRSLDDCTAAIDLTNRKLRAMALQLNPPLLDQLGLEAALQWMADEIQRSYQLEVVVQDDGRPKPMEPAVSATLFRAVRELLVNVSRHAKVNRAIISTQCSKDRRQLELTVSDAGTGFDPAGEPTRLESGLGLMGMRERLGYLGGQIEVRSAPGKGTQVVIRVPLLETVDNGVKGGGNHDDKGIAGR